MALFRVDNETNRSFVCLGSESLVFVGQYVNKARWEKQMSLDVTSLLDLF